MNVNHLYNFGTINEVQGGVVVIGADGRAEAIDDVHSQEAQAVENAVGEVTDYSAAVGKCFKNTSAFVREKVKDAVEKVYSGSHADLALMEVALYDHGLLRKRNAHTAFVKALAAWDIIQVKDEKDMKLLIAGITDKFKRLPEKGYLDWDEIFVNDRNMCINIGESLGSTIKYIRN